MKKYLAVFFAVAALSAVSAYAGKDEFKACFKKCMKQLDDKEKCDYICEPLLQD